MVMDQTPVESFTIAKKCIQGANFTGLLLLVQI